MRFAIREVNFSNDVLGQLGSDLLRHDREKRWEGLDKSFDVQ